MPQGKRTKSPKRNQLHWLAKLSQKEVREIRDLCSRGASQHQLAEYFKISQATVSNIVNGKIYRQVA